MALTFEQFLTSLPSADVRASWGVHLTDVEVQQVLADPQATRTWYDYVVALGASQAAPVAETAATLSAGGHDVPQASASAPYGDHAQTAVVGDGIAPSPFPGGDEGTQKKSRVGLWVTLSIVGALILIAAIVTAFAFSTARHWTKIDVPEKPETFHSEEFETGRYIVTDDGKSPCAVDQDWTDCITAMEAQYAGACADVELVPLSSTLCGQHRTEIDRMIAEDGEGRYVASLGSFGHLTKTPEIDIRQVSNDDFEPAVTHEAVCYLGFLGECE